MATNKDIVEGNVEQLVGKGQAALGEVSGNTQAEIDGKLREIKGKAQEAYGKAREVYGKASETVKDWAEHAPETVREAKEKAARAAEEARTKVRSQVQEQPLATLAGGIALGFVIGWLLNSRK